MLTCNNITEFREIMLLIEQLCIKKKSLSKLGFRYIKSDDRFPKLQYVHVLAVMHSGKDLGSDMFPKRSSSISDDRSPC